MENDDTMKWCRKTTEWNRDERSEEPMDKKSVRAVAVTIFPGYYFWRACLQAESQARRQEKS